MENNNASSAPHYNMNEVTAQCDVHWAGVDYHAEHHHGRWYLFDEMGEFVGSPSLCLKEKLEAMKAEAEAEKDGEPDQYWPYLG